MVHLSIYLWALIHAGEVFEADPTHDYVNIDEEDPYPYAPLRKDILAAHKRTRKFKGKPRVWYLGDDPQRCSETQSVHVESETGFWIVSEQDIKGGIEITYSPSTCLLNRCRLESSFLPSCEENKNNTLATGMDVVSLLEEAELDHPSLSQIFTTSLSLLSWDSLVHYLRWEFKKESGGVLQDTAGFRADRVWRPMEYRWQENLELLMKMISISYATLIRLRKDSVSHCLYSWHGVTVDISSRVDAGTPKPAMASSTTVVNSVATTESDDVKFNFADDVESLVGLRHTGFAAPAGRCPHLLKPGSAVGHLNDIRRHFDPDDRVALLKQTRVHAQALMAVIRLLLQDFRKSGAARAVYAIHNLTEATLAVIANLSTPTQEDRDLARDSELERWYHVIQQIESHDWRALDSLTPEPWQPVYSGRVPAFILHLRKWHNERLDNLMAGCRLDAFQKPTNGYHSLVGFGVIRNPRGGDEAPNPQIVDVCTGRALLPGQKVTFKTPMSTTLTHLHDWTRDWREDRQHLLRNCEILQDPVVGKLLARIYVVQGNLAPAPDSAGGNAANDQETDGNEEENELRQFMYDNYTTIEEFVEGRNLRELLLSDDSNAAEQRALVGSTTRQLLHFWRAGYGHGDLSLGNILVKNDPPGQIKVIDAGSLKKDSPRFIDDRYFQHLRELFPNEGDSLMGLVPDLSRDVPTSLAIRTIEQFVEKLAQQAP